MIVFVGVWVEGRAREKEHGSEGFFEGGDGGVAVCVGCWDGGV